MDLRLFLELRYACHVTVTVAGVTSDPFPIAKNATSPSLLYFGATAFVAATHADGSLFGPAYLSVPGFAFRPAKVGETVVLYGVGFGGTATPSFAGLIAPGLYQFNVVIPQVPPGEAAVRMLAAGGNITTGLLAIELP